jgi:hypothetical protein
MQVAVYRYVPTSIYEKINGETWEKQHQQLIAVVEARNEVEACKAYPPSPYTLAFIRVEDGDE